LLLRRRTAEADRTLPCEVDGVASVPLECRPAGDQDA
jgi:hypothetical protein